MKYVKIAALTTVLILFGRVNLTFGAHDFESGVRYWGYYAPVMSTLGAGNAMGFGVEFNRHTFSVRTAATDTQPMRGTWDIAVMYGRAGMIGSFYATGSTGAAVIAGEQYPELFGGESEGTMEPMLAFPLEGQLSWPVNNILALGIYAFLNVNTNQPFGGIGLTVRLGKLK